MKSPEARKISGDGVVFHGAQTVGRAHVDIPLSRAQPERDRPITERTGRGRRMGKIRFEGQGQLGPPIALIGQQLRIRLDDDRLVEFMLFDSGNIHVLSISK